MRLSHETQREIKAFKSLDAFAHMACNWIRRIEMAKMDPNFVVVGKVQHSQSITAPPLSPWIIVAPSSEILASHCDCRAGLGEACTHVAALLHALEYAVMHKSEKQSVTDVLCQWIKPSRKGEYSKELTDINFSNPKRLLENPELCKFTKKSKQKIPELTAQDRLDFFGKLHSFGVSVAAMLPVSQFSIRPYENMPKVLSSLFHKDNTKLTLLQLQNMGEELNIKFTEEQAVLLATENQAKEKAWFDFRAGRVTASNFKSSCRTKLENPSISLIKKICYPSSEKKLFKAGVYGCQHENKALETFKIDHKMEHPSAEISKCGLFLHPSYPYFGASPDGILNCPECGVGCVEVKCPYCVRDTSVATLISFKNSCLQKEESDRISLKEDHPYYYQIQMQMALTNTNFCEFLVWTKDSYFYERIFRNNEFWEAESGKARMFFFKVLIPELLGKYFTNKKPATSTIPEEDTPGISSAVPKDSKQNGSERSPDLWCYCRKPDDGSKMVQCDNRWCKIQWFHKRCTGLLKIPRGKWYCKDCEKVVK